MSLKKKIIILCLVLFLIVLGITIFWCISHSKDDSNNDHSKEVIDDNKIPSNAEVDVTTSDDKEIENQETDLNSQESVSNNNENPTKIESNENKEKENDKNNKPENHEQQIEKPEENIVEKNICLDTDVEYQKWLSDFLKVNTSSRHFNSLEEAKKFGETSARNYGYGYFYNPSPVNYDNGSCYRENYFVQLYIPAESCLGNPMMYLPNTEKVINMYQYLDKIGYSCPEKIW